jgi:ABC-2 type transport system ATP-binding protein
MGDALLEIRDVQKSFPGFRLGPISLSLQGGVAYGLLGPNGAGKTTLLNCVTLQLKLTSGQILYKGAPILWGDTAWKVRFSYIRETPSFYDEFTVGGTLRLAGRLYGTWDEPFAQNLLDRFRLEKGRKVGTLSKGNKVKLGLVAALAHHAEVLILDEPTAGLDPTARAELQQLLRELMKADRALCVVISSHIFEDIEEVADEVLILRSGKLVFGAPLRDLAAMSVFRLPAATRIARSAGIQLAWRKDGFKWVVARGDSRVARELLSLPGCIEESPGATLSKIYHGTENYVECKDRDFDC